MWDQTERVPTSPENGSGAGQAAEQGGGEDTESPASLTMGHCTRVFLPTKYTAPHWTGLVAASAKNQHLAQAVSFDPGFSLCGFDNCFQVELPVPIVSLWALPWVAGQDFSVTKCSTTYLRPVTAPSAATMLPGPVLGSSGQC